MQSLVPPDLHAAARLRSAPRGPIAVASLSAADQSIIQALRAARAARVPGQVRLPAGSVLPDAVARYARELRRDDEDRGAVPASGDVADLNRVEARTLDALACLRAGLLGDAWKILGEICRPGRVGDALLALEQVATFRIAAGPSGLS